MRRKKIFVFILLAIATLLVCQYIVGWPLKRLALSAAPALVLFWRLFFVILWSVFLFWLLMPYLAAGGRSWSGRGWPSVCGPFPL